MWKLYVQFLTFPSHDVPQSEPRSGKRHGSWPWESSLPDATAPTNVCHYKFLSTACAGQAQSVCKCCNDLTTSETALCSYSSRQTQSGTEKFQEMRFQREE